MLDGFDCFAVGSLILEGLPMLDKLLAGLRMFTFREPVELIGANGSSEAVFFGKLTLPFALHGLPLAPITLIRRSEFSSLPAERAFEIFSMAQSPNENPL
jgi:hypothetical protein